MNPFHPFPRLETQRSVLRQLDRSDAAALLESFVHSELPGYGSSAPFDTIEEAEAFIERAGVSAETGVGVCWGIEDRASRTVIGSCGFDRWVKSDCHARLTFELHPSMRGRGILSEVLPVVVEWGFTHMGLHRIGAIVPAGNVPSMHLLMESGFQREGVLRQSRWVGGRPEDLVSYSLLRTDARQRAPSRDSANPRRVEEVEVIRLGAEDADRYIAIRRMMLAEAPWAFDAAPDDDRALDPLYVAGAVSEPENTILAIEEPARPTSPVERRLAAVAGITRQRSPKFKHRARLWGVYVHPDFRARGFGRRVVEAAIEEAREWKGVDYIDLSVSERSPEAWNLYASLGFIQWGREPETVKLDEATFDEIYMTLRLGGGVSPSMGSGPEPRGDR